MLSNRELLIILSQNKKDLTKFATYLGESRQAIKFRMLSDKPKNSLYGVYVEYLINNSRIVECAGK